MYKFNKFVSDTHIEVTKHESALLNYIDYIDITIANFYLKSFIIHPRYIPEGSILNSYQGSDFLVEESDQLFLLKIYKSSTKGKLNCRTSDMLMKEITLDIKNLKLVNNEIAVKKEFAYRLEGEYVMYLKTQDKYFLMIDQNELWIKTKTKDQILKKTGASKIEAIQDGLVWAFLPDGEHAQSSFPIFCLINQIDLKSNPKIFVGMKITTYTVNKQYYFKLKCSKAKNDFNLTTQNFKNDYTLETQQKINYKNFKNSDRICCNNFPQVFEKPEFNFKEYFISQPALNKNLASVIGLGIIEHLVRFKSDESFRNFIENTFTKANVVHVYKDLIKILDCNSISEIHQKVWIDNFANIERLGKGLISLLKNDIETFEGLQEFCDTTGCCIHLRNFTEGFKQVKIVPTHYLIKTRPIINLGKYFNDYFLIYSEEIMNGDGFLNADNKNKMNFPYYDKNFEKEEKLLSDFINGIISRINEIRDSLDKKLSGKKKDDEILDFVREANLYKAYLYENCGNNLGGQVAESLGDLNFGDLLNKVCGKKYFCNCGCNEYFEEASNIKKTCICKKDYCKDHLLSWDRNVLCYCKNMSVRDVLDES